MQQDSYKSNPYCQLALNELKETSGLIRELEGAGLDSEDDYDRYKNAKERQFEAVKLLEQYGYPVEEDDDFYCVEIDDDTVLITKAIKKRQCPISGPMGQLPFNPMNGMDMQEILTSASQGDINQLLYMTSVMTMYQQMMFNAMMMQVNNIPATANKNPSAQESGHEGAKQPVGSKTGPAINEEALKKKISADFEKEKETLKKEANDYRILAEGLNKKKMAAEQELVRLRQEEQRLKAKVQEEINRANSIAQDNTQKAQEDANLRVNEIQRSCDEALAKLREEKKKLEEEKARAVNDLADAKKNFEKSLTDELAKVKEESDQKLAVATEEAEKRARQSTEDRLTKNNEKTRQRLENEIAELKECLKEKEEEHALEKKRLEEEAKSSKEKLFTLKDETQKKLQSMRSQLDQQKETEESLKELEEKLEEREKERRSLTDKKASLEKKLSEKDLKIEELKRLEQEHRQLSSECERLRTLAYKDYLTGVKNSNAFNEEVSFINAAASTLVIVKIYQIEELNAQYGKQTGDGVIRTCADELTQCFGDKLYRTMGAQFAAFSESDEQNTLAVLNNLYQSLAGRNIIIAYGTADGRIYGGDIGKMIEKADIDANNMKSVFDAPQQPTQNQTTSIPINTNDYRGQAQQDFNNPSSGSSMQDDMYEAMYAYSSPQ